MARPGRSWSLLLALMQAAAGNERYPMRMQRCFASGKLLDLTNGSVGLPSCVDSCTAPAERSVQAEGLGFCMLPIARKAAFDVSFTLELQNVSLKDLPSLDQLRSNVPIALGQALQVPPADVLGEVMVRDAGQYEAHRLHAFQLRRRDEVEEPGAEVTRMPTPAPKVSRNRTNGTNSTGVRDSQAVRGRMPRPSPFSPCRSGFCNVYLAMRCEVWRIADLPGSDLPDSPFVRALHERSPEQSVVQALGLSGNWSVKRFIGVERPHDSTPLEVVRADPVFRFTGLPWNYDPVHGNLTGKWNEFGDLDPRFKYEDKALEQIFIAFVVLMALFFAILGQQRLAPLSGGSLGYADPTDWHAGGGLQNRAFRRPWPMRKETRKMLGLRTA